MGWSVGYDNHWQRDIGYGIPSICDHPECDKEINRGLGYVCKRGEPYGGEDGCGLYFCGKHQVEECDHHDLEPTPDTQEWIIHKLTHESWGKWRETYPEEVKKLRQALHEQKSSRNIPE